MKVSICENSDKLANGFHLLLVQFFGFLTIFLYFFHFYFFLAHEIFFSHKKFEKKTKLTIF